MEDENRGSPMTQETPIGFLYSKVGNPPMDFPAMFVFRDLRLELALRLDAKLQATRKGRWPFGDPGRMDLLKDNSGCE